MSQNDCIGFDLHTHLRMDKGIHLNHCGRNTNTTRVKRLFERTTDLGLISNVETKGSITYRSCQSAVLTQTFSHEQHRSIEHRSFGEQR